MIDAELCCGITNTLNYKTAGAVVELFDVCYKQGVIHAYQYSDDNAARAFVEDSRKIDYFATLCDTDMFGRIVDGRSYNFRQWRLLLSFWARRSTRRQLIEWYLDKTPTGRGRFGTVYSLCMDFYLQGIYHYTCNPVDDIELFLSQRNALLVLPSRLYKRKIRDIDLWLKDIQMMCYERSKMTENIPCENGRPLHVMFDLFARTMWNCVNGRREVMRQRNNEQKRNKRKRKKGADISGAS